MPDLPFEDRYHAVSESFRVHRRRWSRYEALRKIATQHFANRYDPSGWSDGILTRAEHETLFATATGLYLPLAGEPQHEMPVPTDRVDGSNITRPSHDVLGREALVSADFLRWLCTDRSIAHLRDSLGVFCAGCVVVGEFRVDFLRNPALRIAALRSVFLGTVSVRSAKLKRLCLRGSQLVPSGRTSEHWKGLAEVSIDDTQVFRNPWPNSPQDHLDFKGEFDLASSTQQGEIDVRALSASGLTLSGDADFSRGLIAEGPLELDNCVISGSIDLSDSQLQRDEMGEDYYPALTIGNGHVGHDLILTRAAVTGVTHLSGIKVEGNVDLQGTTLEYDSQPNHAWDQPSGDDTQATRISCYRAALTLLEAEIGGHLDLSAAPAKGWCYEFSPAGPS